MFSCGAQTKNSSFPLFKLGKYFVRARALLRIQREEWVALLGKTNKRTLKCPFVPWQFGKVAKPTHPCGTFGQVCAKLRWAGGQHHSAKEWMWDDLNGPRRQLLLLLLAGQLHHLLHETYAVLRGHCTHCLGVGVAEREGRIRCSGFLIYFFLNND